MSHTDDSSVEICADLGWNTACHDGAYVGSDASTTVSMLFSAYVADERGQDDVMAPRSTMLKSLGKGVFGDVYEAIDETGMPVAVKTSSVKAIRTSQDETPTAFRREFDTMRIVATTQQKEPHPNIVQAYSYGVDGGGREFFTMELMSKGSLQDAINALETTNEVFSEDEIRCVLREVLTGLEHLHRRGVVHADIKPANILLGDSGAVKICDFGYAGREGPVPGDIGTVEFMSYEAFMQLRLFANDVWAVGCCVGYLATGKKPWADSRREGVVICYALDTGKQPFEPTDFEHLTPPLRRLLERLFVPRASKRPTATELLADPFFSTVYDDACGDISATGRTPTSFPAQEDIAEIEEVRYRHAPSSKSI